MIYADVIVDISLEKLDKTFQYAIPAAWEGKIRPGMQVEVPFGNGGRKVLGYVMELSENPKIAPERIKELLGAAEGSIPIESRMIALAAWMKRRYGGTMNQALKTVIPVKKQQSKKERRTVVLRLDEIEAQKALAALTARKRHSAAKERLLEELIRYGSIPWEEITERLGIPSALIREMEKSGAVRILREREYRDPLQRIPTEERIKENSEQRAVIERVREDFKNGERRTYLLHGVTGSGKTLVYMELVEDVLARGRSAIVLIPEIALTYQTIMRFYSRFGSRVSFIHSRMSPAERFDQFERAKCGDISVMVGPRSALFTPFADLGLIVIDEEHETSYKSETVPRYHARETAIALAQMCGASVVLGSATPSVESFAAAEAGEYVLLTLPHRAKSRPLPVCETVDLRRELREGNRSILSRRLQELMEERLRSHEQIMLFLNRRGMMGFVSCRACGHVIKCPHCDVSLSLHGARTLRCHYCGFSMEQPKTCPACGSAHIGGFKAGTQKVEEIVRQRFPQARLLRMDTDSTRGKDGHRKIVEAFAGGEADILIGTQMIVKGHDFPNVTLVGILAADLSLNASDYGSAERTFQLLTQAAGRAGRGGAPGRVVIQTYHPEHYSIQAAKAQDYSAFFANEIAYRRLMDYPPAAHMLVICTTSPSREDAAAAAEQIAGILKKTEERLRLLGPTDAPIAKIQDVYKKVLYIKDKDAERLIRCKDKIEEAILHERVLQRASVWFDLDPMGLI